MQLPRILITNFHPGLGGGHDTFIRSLADLDLKRHFQFALAVPKTSHLYEIAKERGIQVYPSDFPSNVKEIVDIFRSVKRFADLCKAYKPMIIQTNGGADNDIVAWSLLFQKKNFKILRTHHAVREMPTDPYHAWLYRRVVDWNVYVSQTSKELSQSGKSLKIPNYTVIENGVDTELFKPQEPDMTLRRRLAIPDDHWVFGSCAGTSAYKRLDVMFEAARALKDSHKFRIVILGQEQNRQAIMHIAATLGVDDQVIYGGFHEDVRPYCSLFDVGFILSDSIETISYASREMLSMGIPLISSSYSGLKENIDDGRNGFLVRPGNADDVKDRMKDFMQMGRDGLARFKQEARRKAVTAFGITRQMESFHQLYGKLLAE
jgi:glycosyltransferase involved in cell wall biosynthesis